MNQTIRVQPAARLRREFAVWATAQQPKIRTTAPNTFAVPANLFARAPEEILIGALVDGHRYVSPDEDQPPQGQAATWRPPLLPERISVPGQPLPDLPAEAYGPDSVPLDPPDYAPLEDAPADGEELLGVSTAAEPAVGESTVLTDAEPGAGSDSSDSGTVTADASHECEDCGRPYATLRGLNSHRRTKHAAS